MNMNMAIPAIATNNITCQALIFQDAPFAFFLSYHKALLADAACVTAAATSKARPDAKGRKLLTSHSWWPAPKAICTQ